MPDSKASTRISVVVASIVGTPFIDDCLASLEEQTKRLDAEIIVVACGSRGYAQRIEKSFPWVHVLHESTRRTVPELRCAGVEQASGEIVAIIEEHCLASRSWLDKAIEGHKLGQYSAVGGPILDHNYSRLEDWVVYFCEYSGYLPPWAPGQVYDLNGANIAYNRQVLVQHKHLLSAGYWEATLHPVLLREGNEFLSVPEMVVSHRGPFPYGYYLQQRYWFSRAFAGTRAKTLSLTRRAAYILAAPVIPGILVLRIASRVRAKRCHVGKFVRSFPLLLPALAVYAAGEWVGHLVGPGNALLKVE